MIYTHIITTFYACEKFAMYGYMMKITEKSDVYSYSVVVLEVLKRKQPIDPTIPDGLHIVDWVRQKRGGIEILDPSLRARPESEIEQILQTLGVAMLFVNPSTDYRPTMKDVAAMLKEIRQEREEYMKVDVLLDGCSAKDQPDCSRYRGEPAPKMKHSYPLSNNSNFSSSLGLYYPSSSSNTRVNLK